jgi:hypothetical protein
MIKSRNEYSIETELCICFAKSNQIFVCEFVRIFCCEYKQVMPVNGVGEYTETCEYEANKIHIRFDSLQKVNKKVANISPSRKYVHTYYVYHGR